MLRVFGYLSLCVIKDLPTCNRWCFEEKRLFRPGCGSGRLTAIAVSGLLLQTCFMATDLFMLYACEPEFCHIFIVPNTVCGKSAPLFYEDIQCHSQH